MKTETFKQLGDKRLMEEGIASAFGSAEAGSSNGEGKIFIKYLNKKRAYCCEQIS